MIQDSVNYSFTRIADVNCDESKVDTQSIWSTYNLSHDTVQFYLGDGNEIEFGLRAIVTSDSLIAFSGSPNGRLAFSRRKSTNDGN